MAETKERVSSGGGLMAALLAAQEQFPKIKKTRTARIGNKFSYSYADLGDMLDQLGPVLRKNGIAYTFPIESENGSTRIGCRLMHAQSGADMAAWLPLSVPEDPRELGSKITYFRRYLFANVCGVQAEEDDDGGAASAGAANRRAGSTSPTMRASEPQAGASASPSVLERLQKAEIHFRVSVFGGSADAVSTLFQNRFGTADLDAISGTYSPEEIHLWLDKKAVGEAEELKKELAEKEANHVF